MQAQQTKRTECSHPASIQSSLDRMGPGSPGPWPFFLTSEHQAARRLRNRPATAMAPSPSSTMLEGSGTAAASGTTMIGVAVVEVVIPTVPSTIGMPPPLTLGFTVNVALWAPLPES